MSQKIVKTSVSLYSTKVVWQGAWLPRCDHPRPQLYRKVDKGVLSGTAQGLSFYGDRTYIISKDSQNAISKDEKINEEG